MIVVVVVVMLVSSVINNIKNSKKCHNLCTIRNKNNNNVLYRIISLTIKLQTTTIIIAIDNDDQY